MTKHRVLHGSAAAAGAGGEGDINSVDRGSGFCKRYRLPPHGPIPRRARWPDLWAAAAAADPSWDRMSGERESRGRLCEHIARLGGGMKWA